MRRYLGENLFHEGMAMDEAPARESKSDSDDDDPSFGDLNQVLDEAQAAIDAARNEIRSGADAKDGAFSFDRVRRRIADARDCMDQLEEHLGGSGSGGKDEEPGESERDAAFRRARDGQTDHRRDFDPARTSADSGMAHDIDEIFPARPQADGDAHGRASLLDGIFGP